MSQEKDFIKLLSRATYFIIFVFAMVSILTAMLAYYAIDPNLTAFKKEAPLIVEIPLIDEDRIENGIHVRTGLIEAEGLMTVINNYTNCHSAKLITQNRMNAERWNTTIKWMQETQNLWDLGENQAVIVNYLVTNYPPKAKGRRQNLSEIDWYVLEN